MNERTYIGLLAAGLAANCLFLGLALLDFAAWGSANMWPIFVGWAFLVVLLVVLAISNRLRPAADPQPAMPEPKKADEPKPAAKVVVKDTPFQFNGFTLHARKTELKGGGSQDIYFFAKQKPKSGHPVPKPTGYHVGVNERTGLPFLKRGAGQDGEDLTPDLEPGYRPQCSALTEEGHQCRNSARESSKYCISHFGYQPPLIAKAAAAREDTKPRVKGAADTKPSVRKAA
ncbi:MAG: hypothetical protein QOD77_299 [Thermoplasmata archaeon]|nr:hypothetical protein [Thermoplasmata archaeon]